MAQQHWQAEIEEACPYLEGRLASTDYRILTQVTPMQHEAMLSRGWRRFGLQYFRPECRGCRECVSLRIPVATFCPTKTQRRAWRKCAHLRIEVGPPKATEDRLELFSAWHAMREQARGWKPSPMSADEYAATFCPANVCGREMAYFDGNRLIAVGLVDVTPHAVSSIYFYYHPDAAPWSPGVASILFEIDWARQLGCAHLYLGYRVAGCPSTAYKAQYGPHELLVDRPGFNEEPVWIPK
jgi:arginyl-tRNA--protein-N-Asp/Glu arginylyltransferase